MTTAEQAINAAKDRLADAEFGLADMRVPARSRSGLRNAVVFGRMVTFMLQNMRGHIDGFQQWYDTVTAEMKSDPLMKYFNDLRTEIEKTVKAQTGLAVRLNSFSPSQIAQLPRPPGATAFFIGDQTGGSGWQIALPDGSTEPYYIDLPASWEVKAMLTLPGAPDEYKHTDAADLVRLYLDRLNVIIDQATKRFIATQSGGPELVT